MSPRPYQDCFNTAVRLLSRRDHSCKELGRKLRKRNHKEADIQAAIAECQRFNYLDDKKYAERYTLELQRRGFGPRRIRQKLIEKGVSRQEISSTLRINCLETTERDNCQAALSKKLKSLHKHRDEQISEERLYRFLSGRGFTPAIVRETIDAVLSNIDIRSNGI